MLRFFPFSVQPRQRHIAARLIHVGDGSGASALLQQAHAFPDKAGGAKRIMLGNSAAYGVVVKGGCLGGLVLGTGPAGGGDLGEPVFFIPDKALCYVLASQLADQAFNLKSKLLSPL